MSSEKTDVDPDAEKRVLLSKLNKFFTLMISILKMSIEVSTEKNKWLKMENRFLTIVRELRYFPSLDLIVAPYRHIMDKFAVVETGYKEFGVKVAKVKEKEEGLTDRVISCKKMKIESLTNAELEEVIQMLDAESKRAEEVKADHLILKAGWSTVEPDLTGKLNDCIQLADSLLHVIRREQGAAEE